MCADDEADPAQHRMENNYLTQRRAFLENVQVGPQFRSGGSDGIPNNFVIILLRCMRLMKIEFKHLYVFCLYMPLSILLMDACNRPVLF